MKTHDGNVGKCLCDIGQITFDSLKKFNIPFDEIYFGKPYANVYIDDLAINCCDNLEKELGFYVDKIEPRFFNQLELQSIETYKKVQMIYLAKYTIDIKGLISNIYRSRCA